MNHILSSQNSSPLKSPKISRQCHINAEDCEALTFADFDLNNDLSQSNNELYDRKPLISILTSSPGKHKLQVKTSPAHLITESKSSESFNTVKITSITTKSQNVSPSKLFVDYSDLNKTKNIIKDLNLSRKSSFNSVHFGAYVSNQSIYNSSVEIRPFNSCYNSINDGLTRDDGMEFTKLSKKASSNLLQPTNNNSQLYLGFNFLIKIKYTFTHILRFIFSKRICLHTILNQI